MLSSLAIPQVELLLILADFSIDFCVLGDGRLSIAVSFLQAMFFAISNVVGCGIPSHTRSLVFNSLQHRAGFSILHS